MSVPPSSTAQSSAAQSTSAFIAFRQRFGVRLFALMSGLVLLAGFACAGVVYRQVNESLSAQIELDHQRNEDAASRALDSTLELVSTQAYILLNSDVKLSSQLDLFFGDRSKVIGAAAFSNEMGAKDTGTKVLASSPRLRRMGDPSEALTAAASRLLEERRGSKPSSSFQVTQFYLLPEFPVVSVEFARFNSRTGAFRKLMLLVSLGAVLADVSLSAGTVAVAVLSHGANALPSSYWLSKSAAPLRQQIEGDLKPQSGGVNGPVGAQEIGNRGQHLRRSIRALTSAPLRLAFYTDTSASGKELQKITFKLLLLAISIVVVAVGIAQVFATSLARRLDALASRAMEFAAGRLDGRVAVEKKDEIGALAVCINYMARKLAEFLVQVRDKALLEKELETAHAVQELLLPRVEELRELPFSCFGTCKPASQCGGDFWNVLPMSETRYLILLGDVTGHGTAAAIVTGMATGAIRSMAAACKETKSHMDLPELMRRLNRDLWEIGRGKGTTLTMMIGEIDLTTCRLRYASGAHCPPMLLDKDTEKMSNLTGTGPALGASADAVYEEFEIAFPARGRLCVYSDGITEAQNPAEEEFGRTRLRRIAKASLALPCEEFVAAVETDLYAFVSGRAFDDDRTILALDLSA